MLYPRKACMHHRLERKEPPFVSRLRFSTRPFPFPSFIIFPLLIRYIRLVASERDICTRDRKSLRPVSLRPKRREKVRLWIETSGAITNPGSPLDEGNNGFARCFVITGTCTSPNILLESPPEYETRVRHLVWNGNRVIAWERNNVEYRRNIGGLIVERTRRRYDSITTSRIRSRSLHDLLLPRPRFRVVTTLPPARCTITDTFGREGISLHRVADVLKIPARRRGIELFDRGSRGRPQA